MITGAAQFARQALAIERARSESVPSPTTVFEHRAAVLAAIVMSVASLEASINEVFSDAGEPTGGMLTSIEEDHRALMAAMWNRDIPRTARYTIIEKYEIALTLLRKPQIDRSRKPYQDAKLLIELRNAFIHFEPSWQSHDMMRSSDPGESHRFERTLRGRFAENPLTGAGNPFYPDKLLGHGCAEWAVRSALVFADAFFANLGVKGLYDSHREFLATS